MSTKIYGGFVIRNMSWSDLCKKCMEISDAIEVATRPTVEELIDRLFVKRDDGTPNLSQSTLADKDGKVLSVFDIHQIIYDADKNDSYNAFLNEDLSAVFYPDPDGSNDIYGCVFGNGTPKKIFFELSGAEEYAYWNNTDEPEGMTEEEWDARKNKWEKLVPKNKFSESGFCFEFAKNNELFFAISMAINDENGNKRKGEKTNEL